MGDNGKLYVPETLVPIYRDEVVPAATVVTPNLFECEMLTGRTISSEADALRAMLSIHESGPEVVVLTSTDFSLPGATKGDGKPMPVDLITTSGVCKSEASSKETVQMLASIRTHGRPLTASAGNAAQGAYVVFRCTMRRLRGHYTGTGDLAAALLLGWMHIGSAGDEREPSRWFRSALEKVAASMQAVLARTLAFSETPVGRRRSKGVPAELQLIQSRDDLVKPPLEAVRQIVKIEEITFPLNDSRV
jgi:pyridoxine kinase